MIRLKGQKAIIFDLDDTLYGEMNYVREAFGHVASYLAKQYDLSQTQILEEMLSFLKQEGRGKIFNKVCDLHGIQEDIGKLVSIYRETSPKIQLYKDAESFLQIIEDKRIKTGLVTDGDALVQWSKINALHLTKRLDSVIVTDDLYTKEGKKGRSKPDPYVFQMCLEKLHCKPVETIYIGDNPQKDFIGARKLGMGTIRIKRAEGSHITDVPLPGYEADQEIVLLTDILIDG